ncbi:MAG: hypothetical protein M0R47_16725 [Methylobacter sp.]|uniref:hypothetical protein n=1 Tax=Methylobacter sp. TaxID=2051955 RepID=UPI0025DAAD84|nr:hypothetical protein [Methylobacter sp.]MCK9622167.1 hypothetical protein [Methylobacter sp.]
MNHKTLPEFAEEFEISSVTLRRICKDLDYEKCGGRHLYSIDDVKEAISQMYSQQVGAPDGHVIQKNMAKVFRRTEKTVRGWVITKGFPEQKGICRSIGNGKSSPYFSIAEIAKWLEVGGEKYSVKYEPSKSRPLFSPRQNQSKFTRLRIGKVVPRQVVHVYSDWAHGE